MAAGYKEGATFSARIRQDGFDVYVSGKSSSRAASKAAGKQLAILQSAGKPKGLGPKKTTLAQAMQDYGLQRLPYLKGAAQEARRINKYLRAAGLSTLIVSPLSDAKKADVWFEMSLERPVGTRKIPKGLNGHRRNLLSKTSGSDKWGWIKTWTGLCRKSKAHPVFDGMKVFGNLGRWTSAPSHDMTRQCFGRAHADTVGYSPRRVGLFYP